MNLTVLVGNIGQHPVLRYTTPGASVANVSLATNRVYRDREGNRQQTTEWHRLVVWGEDAKTFAEIVGKGNLVSVRGRLEYKAREIAGEKVQDAVVRVDHWTKLSPRKAQPANATAETGVEAGAQTSEGLPLESEIEGPPFEADDDLETVHFETIAPTAADFGDRLLAEPAPARRTTPSPGPAGAGSSPRAPPPAAPGRRFSRLTPRNSYDGLRGSDHARPREFDLRPSPPGERQEILALAAHHGARSLYVFGSFARGEAHAGSDVDFLVELGPGAILIDLGSLQIDLQDLLGRKVDVVEPDTLHWSIRESVLREAVPL